MRMTRVSALSLLAVAVLASLAAPAVLRSQQQGASPAAQERYEQVPTTDYEKPEPADAAKRKLRRLRSERFDRRNKKADPARFAITEESQSTYGMFPTHSEPEPAVPAALSDAVVIGEVTAAEAFLSADKTGLYSEFAVRVDEVLKGNFAEPGSLISATRPGGAVRFSSGKVVRRGFDGKPLPRVGRRYVLFLKKEGEADDFSIITGYELKGGRVLALDGLDMQGRVVRELAAHREFDGTDEAAFLTAVRAAVAQSLSNAGAGVR